MNAHELTLLQRLWDWVEERGHGSLSLHLHNGRRQLTSVSADRRTGIDQAQVVHGGWESSLSESLQEAVREAGLPVEVEVPADNAERLAIEMNQVRSALGRVAVYQDLSGPSPIPQLVDELVRDHELIETRLDAILHLMVSTRAQEGVSQEVQDLIFEVGEIAAGRRDFTDARELTGETEQ